MQPNQQAALHGPVSPTQTVPVSSVKVPQPQTSVTNQAQPAPNTNQTQPKKTIEEINLEAAIKVMATSLLPSEREAALETLRALAPHARPRVRLEMVRAAQEDLSPTIRTLCVRYLSEMNVNDQAFIGTLIFLKLDPNENVRKEAIAALAKIGMR
jgi:hypothetical protein